MSGSKHAALLLAFLIASCGSGNGLDIKSVVESQPAFSGLVTSEALFGPNLPDLGGTCLAPAMFQYGKLRPVPDTSAGPAFWRPELAAGSFQPNVLRVPVGQRRVTKVSGQRKWKEGSTRYQAATVEYEIVDSGNLGRAGTTYGPFQMRLVFENSPAVDDWVISNQSTQTVDPSAEQSVILGASDCNSGPLRAAADQARAAALDQIERDLAADRGVARTSVANIIESRTIGRQLYLGTQAIPSFLGISLKDVRPMGRQLCGELQAGGHNDWRLGTFADMRSVTDAQVHDVIRLPVDVPDQRIWKPFLSTLGLPTPVYMPVEDSPAQDWGPFSALAVGSGTRFSESNLVMSFQTRQATFRLFCVRDT